LINDNFLRRQLSPLACARCIGRLFEIGQNGIHRTGQREATKAEVGRRLGMSPRNVDRYLLILDAPIIIQHSFDRSEIKLIDAGRVALLPKQQQQDIANRIEAGEPAASVVKQSLAKPDEKTSELDGAFTRLVSSLRREVPRIRGHERQIPSRRLTHWQTVLRDGAKLLRELNVQARS